MPLRVTIFGKSTNLLSGVFPLAIFIVLAATVIYVLIISRPKQARQGTIELTNLPDQYCPDFAAVVATDLKTKNPRIIFDNTVAITDCRFIGLDKLAELAGSPGLIYVKIPGQLAFRIQIDSIKGRYSYAPSLGDVNNDNVIDALDENQVAAALFSNQPESDLDQDKKVSVLDLSLTRVNRRAGSARPDGQNWSQI